jgi:TolB-like protein/Tfp pilus assembly protein PilF
MSDVFVSYKAEDRKRVAPLVEALEADGLSVWWDAQIGGGDEWRRSIEQQLDAAKCVLVVWSKRSTAPEGRFVRDEASRAMERGVYLPVRIDNVRLPLGFGETQALALTGWKSGANDPRYRAVLGAVRAIVGGHGRHEHRAVPHERGVDRRLVLGGGAAALVAAGVGGWFLLKPGSAEAAGSIAVLPFANLSSDPNQAYFSDGLAEELRSALARSGLQVVGRMSSEAVRGADAETAAKKLGVANILTGSVRRSPSTIRVSAQLIKGSDGLERWSQDYDRKPGDELTIQSDIAQNVAEALSVALGKAAKAALTLGGTTNAAAQDLFLKADALLLTDDSGPAYEKTIALLDSAIILDPKFANAFALKSLAVNFMTGSTAGPGTFDSGYAQATALAKHAIALAPTLAAGHTALASAYEFQLNLPAALDEYRKAAALPDISVAALVQEVVFLTRLGAFSAALDIARKAEKKDPLNSIAFAREGYALGYSRHYADAIAPLQKAAQLAPTVSRNHTALGFCWGQLGKSAQAEAEYRKASPDDIYRLTGEAILFDRQGNRAASDQSLQQARKIFGDSASYQYAEIYAQRGDKEGAFAALDRAWAIHDPGLTTLKVDPYLDPLRADPHFAAMVKRLNFPVV